MVQQGAEAKDLATFLKFNLLLVKLSKDQADHLNSSPIGSGGMTLKESMPDGWEWGDNPIERLAAAGINVSLHKPVDRWIPWKPSGRKPFLRSHVRKRIVSRLF